VGGATPVLDGRRAAALGALLAGLVAWEAFAGSFPDVGETADIAFAACLLIPGTFATVWLALPLTQASRLPLAAIAFGVLAAAFDLLELGALFNVAKLAAYAVVGFWLVQLLQLLSSVVIVAAIVPFADAFSVWQGPTKAVVEGRPGLFDKISISFRLPGEDASANLGPPDVAFFALFLGTAARYGLRVGWTWASMTALLSLTLVATAVFDLNGLPAIPALSIGFLLPNADLLWRALRTSGSRLQSADGEG
jgi:hypothetical protein